MNDKYSTLKTLYSLVQDSRVPTQFACTPAEIITHHNLPWDTILGHLSELKAEGLVEYSVPSIITMTELGVIRMKREKIAVG